MVPDMPTTQRAYMIDRSRVDAVTGDGKCRYAVVKAAVLKNNINKNSKLKIWTSNIGQVLSFAIWGLPVKFGYKQAKNVDVYSSGWTDTVSFIYIEDTSLVPQQPLLHHASLY